MEKRDGQIKTVFIDFNGTLSTSKFWGQMESEDHPHHQKFEKIVKPLFLGELRDLLGPWMRGDLKSEEVMEKIHELTGLDYNFIFEEFIDGCKQMEYVSDQVISLIGRLREKGVKVVVATDNMDSFDRWTGPSMNVSDIFDGVLNSYNLGALKKDFDEKGASLFFADYLRSNGLDFSECVLIDDAEDRDGRIGNTGIRYQKIDFGEGLELELERILEFISEK